LSSNITRRRRKMITPVTMPAITLVDRPFGLVVDELESPPAGMEASGSVSVKTDEADNSTEAGWEPRWGGVDSGPPSESDEDGCSGFSVISSAEIDTDPDPVSEEEEEEVAVGRARVAEIVKGSDSDLVSDATSVEEGASAVDLELGLGLGLELELIEGERGELVHG
jgi:hypothetical protein